MKEEPKIEWNRRRMWAAVLMLWIGVLMILPWFVLLFLPELNSAYDPRPFMDVMFLGAIAVIAGLRLLRSAVRMHPSATHS